MSPQGRRLFGRSGNPPGQGPFMHLTLLIVEGVVREATYETYQCPACHDCGRAVCALVVGHTVEEARKVDRQAVAERVGPLPRARALCYSLAAVALADALAQLDRPGELVG